jgi:DsbC/DsbD-like thiol-disulfide interchange protein
MTATSGNMRRTAEHAAIGLLALSAVALFPPAVSARAPSPGHAEVQLITEETSVKPGRPVEVAVVFKIEQGWHLYWRNPGDAGLGPVVTWHLPPGWAPGAIQWPYPERIDAPPITSYGYTGEVALLAKLTPPRALEPGGAVTLRARVEWLACNEECVGGSTEVVLSLPVAAQDPVADERWAERFAAARARLPVKPPGWTIHATVDDEHVVLDLTPPAGFDAAPAGLTGLLAGLTGLLAGLTGLLAGVQFFPYDDNLIDHGAAQELSTSGGAFHLRVSLARTRAEMPARVTGILVSPDGWGGGSNAKAIEIDVPIERKES